MSANYCTCGRETKDAAYVCDACLTDLANDLNECPGLNEELEVTITRQRGAAITGGSANSGETALPWHDKASDAQRELHATLAGWVRVCDEEGVRHQNHHDNLPGDTIEAMSRWLLWRVDGLAFHEAGYEVVREIGRATERTRNIVFFKPQPRMYLGSCVTVYDDGPCPGEVYAKQGDIFGKCEECGEVYGVEQSRASLERRLDDRLCTAAEIAHLATYLGLKADRERVRKLVNQWHKRQQIQPKGQAVDGAPRFLYGEVRPKLYAVLATRESA